MQNDIKGIDISGANGNFDITSAISQGAKFVIIKCGYGSDYESQDDSQYQNNIDKCEAAGLPYGIYLYSYAMNSQSAKTEADHAIRMASKCGENLKCGIWIDMEDADSYKENNGGATNGTLVNICDTFCQVVSDAGYYTGIYASASWWKDKLNSTTLNKWPKWVAHWGVSTPGYIDNTVVMWQYTNALNDVATPTSYDWNYSYKDWSNQTEDFTTADVIEIATAIANQTIQSYFAGLKTNGASDWSREYLKKMIDMQLFEGDGMSTATADNIRPRDYIKREELAKVIVKFINREEQ